jgi:hypothetical protein
MRLPPRALAGALALVIAGIALHSVGASALRQRAQWPADETYVNLPSTSAARWSYLGYNEVGADLTWIRLLVYYGSGFIGEGDFRYLSNFVSNVIVLDPKFKRVYEWASYTVTVTEDHQISTAAKVQREGRGLHRAGHAEA